MISLFRHYHHIQDCFPQSSVFTDLLLKKQSVGATSSCKGVCNCPCLCQLSRRQCERGGGDSTRLLKGLVIGGKEENRGGEGGQKWPNMDLCCIRSVGHIKDKFGRQGWSLKPPLFDAKSDNDLMSSRKQLPPVKTREGVRSDIPFSNKNQCSRDFV